MNVFLIASPLQLLNALEAQRRFRLPVEECDLLLLVLGSPGNRQQLERLVDAADWNRIHVISCRRRSRFLRWLELQRRLAALARGCGRIERLFLGNYLTQAVRNFAGAVTCESVWSLDDGTATLWINKLRQAAGPGREKTRLRPSPLVKRVLFGVKDSRIDRLNYFTIYPVDPRPGEEVVKNTYERLRGLATSWTDVDEVYFLGEPYSEYGVMPGVEVYMRYLKGVRDHFGDAPIVYLPHRREDPGKLKVIERDLGMTLKSFGLPIELAICKHGIRPACLAALISSAVGNLQAIFRGAVPIKSFRIHPKDVVPAFRAKVEEYCRYYRTLEADGLRIVGLDPDGGYQNVS